MPDNMSVTISARLNTPQERQDFDELLRYLNHNMPEGMFANQSEAIKYAIFQAVNNIRKEVANEPQS